MSVAPYQWPRISGPVSVALSSSCTAEHLRGPLKSQLLVAVLPWALETSFVRSVGLAPAEH